MGDHRTDEDKELPMQAMAVGPNPHPDADNYGSGEHWQEKRRLDAEAASAPHSDVFLLPRSVLGAAIADARRNSREAASQLRDAETGRDYAIHALGEANRRFEEARNAAFRAHEIEGAMDAALDADNRRYLVASGQVEP